MNFSINVGQLIQGAINTTVIAMIPVTGHSIVAQHIPKHHTSSQCVFSCDTTKTISGLLLPHVINSPQKGNFEIGFCRGRPHPL